MEIPAIIKSCAACVKTPWFYSSHCEGLFGKLRVYQSFARFNVSDLPHETLGCCLFDAWNDCPFLCEESRGKSRKMMRVMNTLWIPLFLKQATLTYACHSDHPTFFLGVHLKHLRTSRAQALYVSLSRWGNHLVGDCFVTSSLVSESLLASLAFLQHSHIYTQLQPTSFLLSPIHDITSCPFWLFLFYIPPIRNTISLSCVYLFSIYTQHRQAISRVDRAHFCYLQRRITTLYHIARMRLNHLLRVGLPNSTTYDISQLWARSTSIMDKLRATTIKNESPSEDLTTSLSSLTCSDDEFSNQVAEFNRHKSCMESTKHTFESHERRVKRINAEVKKLSLKMHDLGLEKAGLESKIEINKSKFKKHERAANL